MAGQNIGRWENLLTARKKNAESGRCQVSAEGERCQNLNGKSQPSGNAQINKNGLI